jgi:hypothetical protein
MKQLKRFIVFVVIALTTGISVKAQDRTPPVLPNFSALIKTGKIQLDFISGFTNVAQIGVQRSLDSVLNFYTIGYVDKLGEQRLSYQDFKPQPGSNYYRLFIQFKNGRYMFSKTIMAVPDSTIDASQKLTAADVKDALIAQKEAQAAATTNPQEKEKLKQEIKEEAKEVKVVWHPSNYIYTTADGNVNIKLPDAGEDRKFHVKFFEADGTFLFEINDVKEPFLILEKAIFLHSGWFNFEIYQDGKEFEKWNLFIPLNYHN